jgi:hypothetical protein
VGYRVLLTEKQVMTEIVPELPPAPPCPGWSDLRQRLGRAARELHFVAYAGDSADAAHILSFSERFAELALSIPAYPEIRATAVPFPAGLVDAKMLLAAHILQYDEATDSETFDVPANK